MQYKNERNNSEKCNKNQQQRQALKRYDSKNIYEVLSFEESAKRSLMVPRAPSFFCIL